MEYLSLPLVLFPWFLKCSCPLNRGKTTILRCHKLIMEKKWLIWLTNFKKWVMLLFIRSRWEDMRTPQVPSGFRKPRVKTTFSHLIWINTDTVHFLIMLHSYFILTSCFVNLEIKRGKMENSLVVKVENVLSH